MVVLACPEICSYLIEARARAGHREKELRVKESSDARNLMLSDRALIALNAIESAIVNSRRQAGGSFEGLVDADILEAIENTTKNLETEESGLIYEHRGATARIDELSRGIRDAIESLNKDMPHEARPRRADLVRALNFTRDALQAHMKRPSGGPEGAISYLRFISLFHPWPEDATRTLIV